ncbi:MAG TPA: dihydrofolate reductase family protein [Gaiellaceae bacterium]|jgi:dihydrofolate reductase|nr:dihydrofolate reductase family protein [Gaiellaceae bacterium]
MRKLKLAMYVALDGVVENPAWTGPFWDDQLARLQDDYLQSSDALVLGRVTYEGFAAAWPTMEESTGDFGRKMNSMPKHVASRTLKQTGWNATLIEGELADGVSKLKEEPGGDLLIYGSGEIVDELTRAHLIDEYRLMLHPVVVGTGKRLFNGLEHTTLRLADSTTTGTGVAVHTYEATA